MNVIAQALSLIETEDYQGVISLLEENSSEGVTHPEYYWLYGLTLYLLGRDSEAQNAWLEGLLIFSNGNSSLLKCLRNFLECQVSKPVDISISAVSKVCDAVKELDSIYYHSHCLSLLEEYLKRAKKEALSLALAKKDVKAEKIYECLISIDSNDNEIYYQLGMVYFQLEEYQPAIEAILESIKLNPDFALCYYGLGIIFEKLQNYNEAVKAYNYAIEKDNQLANAYINLGNILTRFGEKQAVEHLYKKAIRNKIVHFGIYLSYGNYLLSEDRVNEAINLYEEAIPLFSKFPDIYHNLSIAQQKIGQIMKSKLNQGRALFYEGKDEEAFELLEECRSHYFDDKNFWNEIAGYYLEARKYEQLIDKLYQGIKYFPASILQRIYLIDCLVFTHQDEEARRIADLSINYFSDNIAKKFIFKLYRQSIIPIVYNSQDEILLVRKRYMQELLSLGEDLLNSSSLIVEENKVYLNFVLERRKSYYLHFHGLNDLSLQAEYGKIVFPVINKLINTQNLIKHDVESSSGRIKVGYVCMRGHSIGSIFAGWIKNRNFEDFEVFCYDMGNTINVKNEELRLFSDHYYHCPWDIKTVATQIIHDNLSVLVFVDAGVEPKLHYLTFLRLAPIQCATWGHPITTGSPNVDYFLGSDLMEPDNAQEHYSEKLIRLPNLGVYLNPIEPPTKISSRDDFGLREEDIIFISCQMIAKYLPQYDYIFPEIIKNVPESKIIFFTAYESNLVTQKFRDRLRKIFDNYDLNMDSYCLFMPLLPHEKFSNLLMLSDIFLDTLEWSGCITTWDAIVCGLPVVTLPGKLMRGRQSYGVLKMICVEETIAQNESDYIQLAVRLAVDAEFRKNIKNKIKDNCYRLFNDLTCVKALESFYYKAIRNDKNID